MLLSGKAYIYFGGSLMNNYADLTMTGEAANDYFGKSVSTAGDVNGDGYSDVIVGASGYSGYMAELIFSLEIFQLIIKLI
ncbi:MAG: FG-GAP repeat protein [Ignavibacteria bacterium]|nr:FG-GAP repeat protein [Ignavibacteria bacterium]